MSDQLTKTIEQVRKLSQSRLSHLARATPAKCTESYLVEGDRYCGIRIQIPPYRAEWKIGDREVLILKNQKCVERLPLVEPNQQDARKRKAA